MPKNYEQMWKDLGLDLEAHDNLLQTLNQSYKEIFLARKNRPEGMKYFDFVMSQVHGSRVRELLDAREKGRKVVGSFCVFVPEELILAAGGISVGLCSGAQFGFEQAEKMLPRTTCSMIKSAFGFKLGKVCPYMEASDMIVGENTCDGKKKAYELFAELAGNFYAMDMPQTKSEAARALLKAEYEKFKDKLEDLTGRKIDTKSLKNAIKTVNRKRRAIRRLNEIRANVPSPISGLDALLINQVSFFDDPERFTDSVNKICDEIEAAAREENDDSSGTTPRILVSGCPMALPNWKVPAAVESCGAVIVGEESCVGERGLRWMTEEDGESVEQLMDDIVDRYFRIDCAIFTPNPSRREHVTEMARKYRADGAILYSIQFCQPYQIENEIVERELQTAGLPVLRVETDYSAEDMGRLKTRVEAFVEMLGAAGKTA